MWKLVLAGGLFVVTYLSFKTFLQAPEDESELHHHNLDHNHRLIEKHPSGDIAQSNHR